MLMLAAEQIAQADHTVAVTLLNNLSAIFIGLGTLLTAGMTAFIAYQNSKASTHRAAMDEKLTKIEERTNVQSNS